MEMDTDMASFVDGGAGDGPCANFCGLENLEACLERALSVFCDISLHDFLFFVLFGTVGWQTPPSWTLCLETGSMGFYAWIKEQLSLTATRKACMWVQWATLGAPQRVAATPPVAGEGDHPDSCTGGALCALSNWFFHAYFLAIALKFPSLRARVTAHLASRPVFYENPRQITRGFTKSVRKMTQEVIGTPLVHPLIKQKVENLEGFLFVKKKVKGPWKSEASLSVPAPSRRLGRDQGFASGGTSSTFEELCSHEVGLVQALRQHAADVPCGNPFDGMLRALVFKSGITSEQTIISPDLYGRDKLVYDVGVKILSYNLLACVIRVPVIHKNVLKRVAERAADGDCPRAVLCFECGHCLNFGKGKFKRVNFRPTQVFYCRDQKEKQCSICATTGRIYCSYCGGSDIRVMPLVATVDKEPILRAIIANNAALMISTTDEELDFIVPCLGLPGCQSTVLKRLTVASLLYLTSTPTGLACFKCQQTTL
ncbi:protein UL49 [Common bottlenose dolphin gammaherpesvirus 1 strain Sarasota]|uniref:Protein UL49 n=1 Tax=Common bottlenose dolphin gammaherpesvirus 1 strain Sarasota TaxID=2022783 RepID=A0A1Z1NEA8_9GAMA|nr:protein UL49 [Common bottlenose dolphin gammaherpesvirus 1 strain Sarasota]ARW78128.1 protein UL49 [Common bottlenose dolphin gammaherpesvirus 1 strain Sarasota]